MSVPQQRKYSGEQSRQFWGRVKKIESSADHAELYFAGILLQELESRVLGRLEQIEQRIGLKRERKERP